MRWRMILRANKSVQGRIACMDQFAGRRFYVYGLVASLHVSAQIIRIVALFGPCHRGQSGY